MAIEDTTASLNTPVNVVFAILSIMIMIGFLLKFKGTIPWKQANVLGFVFLSLGLSLHITGHLIAGEVTKGIADGTAEERTLLLIQTLIELAVLLFVLGSTLMAYHNSSEENKSKYKISAITFAILGLIYVLYFLGRYLTNDPGFILGDDSDLPVLFLFLEMIVLAVIYVTIFISAKNAIRPLVGVRIRLLSLISIGFVIVILVDSLIALDIIDELGVEKFFLHLVLHIITVGSMYLLVFMPSFFRKMTGLAAISS